MCRICVKHFLNDSNVVNHFSSDSNVVSRFSSDLNAANHFSSDSNVVIRFLTDLYAVYHCEIYLSDVNHCPIDLIAEKVFDCDCHFDYDYVICVSHLVMVFDFVSRYVNDWGCANGLYAMPESLNGIWSCNSFENVEKEIRAT